jgi:hypothetical protein
MQPLTLMGMNKSESMFNWLNDKGPGKHPTTHPSHSIQLIASQFRRVCKFGILDRRLAR